MGNSIVLVSETEDIYLNLPDFETDKDLCLWQYSDNYGKLYDVTGSKKQIILQYSNVHFDDSPVIAKFQCNKIPLKTNTFTGVRKSTINRKYNNSSCYKYDRIIGDYNGKSYDITNIYPLN